MANKGNAALAVDREVISAFADLTNAIGARLDEARQNEVAPTIAYLTDEDNVGGQDTEEFRQSMTAVLSIIGEVHDKMETIKTASNKVCDMLGTNASVKKQSIAEARQNLHATKKKIEQVGR